MNYLTDYDTEDTEDEEYGLQDMEVDYAGDILLMDNGIEQGMEDRVYLG